MCKTIMGKCSLCGGYVTVPTVWHGIYPPTPTCDSCGATKKDNLPVIPMDPPKQTWIPEKELPAYVDQRPKDPREQGPQFLAKDI